MENIWKPSDSFPLIQTNSHSENRVQNQAWRYNINDFILLQILINSFPQIFSIGQKERRWYCCLSITSWEERWPRDQASSPLSFALSHQRSTRSQDSMNSRGFLKSPITGYSWAGWGCCKKKSHLQTNFNSKASLTRDVFLVLLLKDSNCYATPVIPALPSRHVEQTAACTVAGSPSFPSDR